MKRVDKLSLQLRRLVGTEDDGTPQYDETEETIDLARTAVVVIDMWDAHWCKTFTRRVGELVPSMNRVPEAERQLGLPIVFAPSDVLDFYEDTPQRLAATALPHHDKPAPREFDPPAPPWSGTGGCECGPERPCSYFDAWSRQQADLTVEPADLLVDSNNNQELCNLCGERGITTLLYMGVAANMCLIHRDAGVKNMMRLGFRCILVRDMAFAISGNGYDPDRKCEDPGLTPATGSEAVLRHLEQHWMPSVTSDQLLRAAETSGS